MFEYVLQLSVNNKILHFWHLLIEAFIIKTFATDSCSMQDGLVYGCFKLDTRQGSAMSMHIIQNVRRINVKTWPKTQQSRANIWWNEGKTVITSCWKFGKGDCIYRSQLLCVCVCVCVRVFVCVCIYIYIYREREGERESAFSVAPSGHHFIGAWSSW